MAGLRKIYPFKKPDPNPSPLQVLAHQKDAVMGLSILDANMYNYCA